MAWFIGQSAVMIVLAFLLGLLVGRVIWHQRAAAALEAVDEPTAEIPLPAEPLSAGVIEDPVVAGAVPPAADVPTAADADVDEPTAEIIPEPVKPARQTRKKSEPAVAAVAVTPTPHVDEPPPAPIDDLARIEGIGPKIAAALVEAGLRSFEQLAAADLATLHSATKAARITFTPSISTWAQQAALLAVGDEDAFKTLTDRLINGREPGAMLADDDEPATPEPAAAASETGTDVDETDGGAGPVEPDALDRVEGIGPKIAAALIGGGIRTYRELADAEVTTLEATISRAGIKFAPSLATWSQQAALLADGDEDGFQTLTDRLIAGREMSAAPEARAAEPVDTPAPVAPAQSQDLARVEGIGPKIAAALIDGGIRTYRELADSDVTTLEATIKKSGIKFAPSLATWSQQAALLADGDEDGFADLTRRLVAGREEARQA